MKATWSEKAASTRSGKHSLPVTMTRGRLVDPSASDLCSSEGDDILRSLRAGSVACDEV